MWNCPGYTKPLYFSYIGIFCIMSALFQKVLKRDRCVQVSGEYPKGKFQNNIERRDTYGSKREN